MVPTCVLRDFLENAKEELESLQIDDPLSPPLIRAHLLERQKCILERVVANHNNKSPKDSSSPHLTVHGVQGALKEIEDESLAAATQDMNEAARLAYARLVLYAACRKQSELSLREQMALTASGSIERKDLMDLFALCQTAVRLSFVKDHIAQGSQLFPSVEPSNDRTETPPQKRLERIQKLFLGELGYDAEFGTQEIKRIFFTPAPNEFTGDQELADTFAKTMAAMQALISEADEHVSVSRFSDVNNGGVTRVVAVETHEVGVSPRGQSMPEHGEEQQRQQLHIASQAAALQHQILGELLSMKEEERKNKLAEAERVSRDFLDRVMEKSPGPERVDVLRSIDEPTQRLIAMRKIWEAYIASSRSKQEA